MKKFLMTCAAVMGVSLAFAATSFAATYTADGNTVSIDTTKLTGLTADDQITVVVVKADEDGELPTTISDSDVLYINQEKKDSSFSNFQGMKLKGDSLADGKYIIAVGGAKLDEIITDTFEVGATTPTIKYGDVNKDGEINNKDCLSLKRYVSEWAGYDATTCDLEAADVYKDGEINNKDCLNLKRHVSEWAGYETLPIIPAN